jgi:hypothetical protein
MGYYDKVTQGSSTTIYTTQGQTEPNMRNELENTLDGKYPEIAKGHNVLLRKMRVNSSNVPTECPCRDETTGEPDKNIFCPVCYGHGYLFDEEYVKTYKTLEATNDAFLNKLMPPGMFNIPAVIFYLRYSDTINIFDKIVEVQLDDDGSVTEPINRLTVYTINNAWKYRSDNGKLEYWKLYTHKEDVKYLNPPTYGE